jgi:hypothetical protein
MEMTMINFRRSTSALVLGLALAATATPTLAKSRAAHSGQAARAQAVEGVSPERARALRECSALAAPFKEITWNNWEIDLYRSCMAQHGQPE